MTKIGYLYKKDLHRKRWLMVYLSIQELRLQCGEVESKDIERVDVFFTERFVEGEK